MDEELHRLLNRLIDTANDVVPPALARDTPAVKDIVAELKATADNVLRRIGGAP